MDKKQSNFQSGMSLSRSGRSMLIQLFVTPYFNPSEIPYSEFKEAIASGKVQEVSISSLVIHGQMKPEETASADRLGCLHKSPATSTAKAERRSFNTVRVEDPDLIRGFGDASRQGDRSHREYFFRDLLSWVIPIALFFGVWLFLSVGWDRAKADS